MIDSTVARLTITSIVVLASALATVQDAAAQGPSIRYGSEVPSEVRTIYQRGLSYLVQSQQADGHWVASSSGVDLPSDRAAFPGKMPDDVGVIQGPGSHDRWLDHSR